jgi:hypothetical protein
MSRSRVLAVGVTAVGALVLAAFLAWYLAFRDVAEPVDVGEAVTTFREETETGAGAASPIPEGVYVYDTRGGEETDALTGVTHEYPKRSTITVSGDPCGVRLRWDVLEGRSTTWTICIGDGGWEVAEQDERHTFFGRTERTTYTCTDTPFRPAGDRPGATFRVSCHTDDAGERGDGRVVARETLRVGGRSVATVHVGRRTSFTGGIRGTAAYDFWLARGTGVPVQVVLRSRTTNDSPVGDVRYDEGATLRLRSLVPRR